jgi:aminopeptidase N
MVSKMINSLNDLADMWSLIHAILLLCVAQHCLATHPIDTDRKYLKEEEEPETRADFDYRLPVGITVERYDVEITPEIPIETSDPNKDGFPFEGSVKITLKTEWSNVSSIVLHARRLAIKSHELKKNADLILTEPSLSFENVTEKLTIKLSSDAKLEANVTYTLSISYSGTLDDSMEGFYRSSYMEGGKRKWLGTTQFQSTDARRAFPCLDEPGFKAVFGITINRPKDFNISLANTLLITSTAE